MLFSKHILSLFWKLIQFHIYSTVWWQGWRQYGNSEIQVSARLSLSMSPSFWCFSLSQEQMSCLSWHLPFNVCNKWNFQIGSPFCHPQLHMLSAYDLWFFFHVILTGRKSSESIKALTDEACQITLCYRRFYISWFQHLNIFPVKSPNEGCAS